MGVCHSDCLIRDRTEAPPTWPNEFTLGHEGAGEIVAIGPDVPNDQFSIGDRVAIHCVPGCKNCVPCNNGWSQACRAPDNGGYGLGRDGFFAEYVACRADAAVKIPDGVRIQDAAISPDALLTAYHAVKHAAKVKPEDTIAIVGLGGLGLNGVQVAQHLGAKRILVSDNRRDAVETAIKLGIPREDAFCTADPVARPMYEVLAERGVVVDTVIDFVGHHETVLSAQLTVKPTGTIVLVGALSEQAAIVPVLMISNVITIKGTFCGTVDGLKECLELVASGVVKPEIELGSINDLPQVLQDLDEGKIRGRKVLMPDWSREE
jgi:propanol-preferring alcohol dehydrogenase